LDLSNIPARDELYKSNPGNRRRPAKDPLPKREFSKGDFEALKIRSPVVRPIGSTTSPGRRFAAKEKSTKSKNNSISNSKNERFVPVSTNLIGTDRFSISRKDISQGEKMLTHSSDMGSPRVPDEPQNPLKKVANQLQEHKPKLNTDRESKPNNNKDSQYISKEAKEDLDSKLGSLMSIKFDPPARLIPKPTPRLGEDEPQPSSNDDVYVTQPLTS
jgi:hypothetical protein